MKRRSKRKYLYPILISLFTNILFGSCTNNHLQLLLQNDSRKDSLFIIVKANGSIVFNNYVPKSTSNFSYNETSFKNYQDTIKLEVEIPALNIKKDEAERSEGIQQIIITMLPETDPKATPPIDIEDSQKSLKILVAFFQNRQYKHKAL